MKGNMCPWRAKIMGFWLKLIGGPLLKRLENQDKSNFCLWRGLCAYEGEKWGFLTKTDRGSPYEKNWKITKKATCVYEGEYVPMKGASLCWWLELYHIFIADVLSCITLSLLMSWAVSGFCCWCLELYHASIADVLSCITLLLLMSWAVSCFPCCCLEVCHFAIAVSSILFIGVVFSMFFRIKK